MKSATPATISAWIALATAAAAFQGCQTKNGAPYPIPSVIHATAAPSGDALGVAPAAHHWAPTTGSLTLSRKNLAILIRQKDADALRQMAGVLRADLLAMGFASVSIHGADRPAPGGIFLTLTDNPMPKEAYSLEVRDSAVIGARTPAGILYGTRTLLQMSKAAPGGAIPCGIVADEPEYSHRMLLLDVARKPHSVPVLKDYIRRKTDFEWECQRAGCDHQHHRQRLGIDQQGHGGPQWRHPHLHHRRRRHL